MIYNTPIHPRIQRYIDNYEPTSYIPIHPLDCNSEAKVNRIWGKYHLPFKTLGQAGYWGGPDDK